MQVKQLVGQNAGVSNIEITDNETGPEDESEVPDGEAEQKDEPEPSDDETEREDE